MKHTSSILTTEAILPWPLGIEGGLYLLQRSSISGCFQVRTVPVCINGTVFDVNTVVLSLTSATLYITLGFKIKEV